MRAAADPGLCRGTPLPGSSGVSGGRSGSIGWRCGPRGICRTRCGVRIRAAAGLDLDRCGPGCEGWWWWRRRGSGAGACIAGAGGCVSGIKSSSDECRRHMRAAALLGSRRRGRCGSRLGRRRAKPAASHLLEIDQQVGKPALDGFQMAEPGVGGVELLRKFGDAVLERAERKLIALAELHTVEPLAQSANRAFQLGRHRASAFHQRGDPCLKLGQRFGAAFGGGTFELGAEPAHLGGKLRQRAVGGDIGDDAAQRHHGLLELLERHRIALGGVAGRGDLIDLVR